MTSYLEEKRNKKKDKKKRNKGFPYKRLGGTRRSNFQR